ncbi:hypothetical protein TNCV_172201 [Trichonephila clavipes]|nr:hypothetical protein TNCV_172201 [Trichonephila clavipes]
MHPEEIKLQSRNQECSLASEKDWSNLPPRWILLGLNGSQKVECTVAEGQDVPGTQMIARIVQSEEWSAPTIASIQRHLPPSRHPVPSRETIRRT